MFSDSLLVILTEEPAIVVYDFREDEVLCQIPLEKNYTYNNLLHPPTYANKVLVSTTCGDIMMFNIKTSKKIFTFKSASNSRPNIMVKTPHLNVIGGKYHSVSDKRKVMFSRERRWHFSIDQLEKR